MNKQIAFATSYSRRIFMVRMYNCTYPTHTWFYPQFIIMVSVFIAIILQLQFKKI